MYQHIEKLIQESVTPKVNLMLLHSGFDTKVYRPKKSTTELH